MEVMFFVFSFTDRKQHKARERDMIALRNHAPWRYMPWLPVTLGVLDGAGFENSLYAIGLSENSWWVHCIIKQDMKYNC